MKGYTVPKSYLLSETNPAISLSGAYFFSVKNSPTGASVDVELEGVGVLETLPPGESFKFDGGSADYPLRANTVLRIGFFSGSSIVTVIVFFVEE